MTVTSVTSWAAFAAEAPLIAETFRRRHAATDNLCMLATLRADGSPRISPLEPRFFEDRLWIGGMPGTTKFTDLRRDPRFCLHTATVDTRVAEGDAKLFGVVEDVQDLELHQRYADQLYASTGFDLRGARFEPFYGAVLTGASSVEVSESHMDVRIWKPGREEWVERKH